MLDRRAVLGGVAVAIALAGCVGSRAMTIGDEMYGLIGKLTANEGRRSDLIAILLQGTGAMPGNLVYIIAEDVADPDGIWITEVWTDKAAHAASLKLPAVQAAITQGRPLIAGFEDRHEIRPVGGAGIPRR
jgi:quinol monooxygenase YgiN